MHDLIWTSAWFSFVRPLLKVGPARGWEGGVTACRPQTQPLGEWTATIHKPPRMDSNHSEASNKQQQPQAFCSGAFGANEGHLPSTNIRGGGVGPTPPPPPLFQHIPARRVLVH